MSGMTIRRKLKPSGVPLRPVTTLATKLLRRPRGDHTDSVLAIRAPRLAPRVCFHKLRRSSRTTVGPEGWISFKTSLSEEWALGMPGSQGMSNRAVAERYDTTTKAGLRQPDGMMTGRGRPLHWPNVRTGEAAAPARAGLHARNAPHRRARAAPGGGGLVFGGGGGRKIKRNQVDRPHVIHQIVGLLATRLHSPVVKQS